MCSLLDGIRPPLGAPYVEGKVLSRGEGHGEGREGLLTPPHRPPDGLAGAWPLGALGPATEEDKAVGVVWLLVDGRSEGRGVVDC